MSEGRKGSVARNGDVARELGQIQEKRKVAGERREEKTGERDMKGCRGMVKAARYGESHRKEGD